MEEVILREDRFLLRIRSLLGRFFLEEGEEGTCLLASCGVTFFGEEMSRERDSVLSPQEGAGTGGCGTCKCHVKRRVKTVQLLPSFFSNSDYYLRITSRTCFFLDPRETSSSISYENA